MKGKKNGDRLSSSGGRMPARIRSILRPRYFEDEADSRKCGILSLTVYVSILAALAIACTRLLVGEYSLVLPFSVCLLSFAASLALLRAKRLSIASFAFLSTILALIGFLSLRDDGIHNASIFALPGLLIIAGLLLGNWQYYIFTAISLAMMLSLVALERLGVLRTKYSFLASTMDELDIVFLVAITAVGIRAFTSQLVDNLERVRKSERALRDRDLRLQELLGEKELILKEVHHRIKNNMNTMAALLRLQAKGQQSLDAVVSLKDAASRLDSMMILYDKLYRSEEWGALSLKVYLPALVEEMAAIFPHGREMRIETEVDDVVLESTTMSRLAIILNELITNSMKYAFPGRDDGLIRVKASREGKRVTVSVEDDGIGLPESFSFESFSGFGSDLVHMLVDQIGGEVEIDRRGGTKTTIIFDA